MADEQKARQFFEEVLKCFKIDSFKAVNSMDMLLVVQEEWYNYLVASKEFGFINNVENMDFFVCITSKSGIAFKGDLNKMDNDESSITKIGTRMLWLGLSAILFVPFFKVFTGLQPYVCLLYTSPSPRDRG